MEDAHYQIEQLKKEYQQMNAKHQLSLNGFTLVVGRRSGAPGEVDRVLQWWRDYCSRTNAAQKEFNESLLKLGSPERIKLGMAQIVAFNGYTTRKWSEWTITVSGERRRVI